MSPATGSPSSAWHAGRARTEASAAPLLTRNAALGGCWPGDCDSMAALQLDEPHLREWAEKLRLICVERCNWRARCVSCARPWFAPFQLRLIHAALPAVEYAPSLFPASQFLTRRYWPKLAPWRAAGPPIASESSGQLQAGVAPWRSSPRQRWTDRPVCHVLRVCPWREAV